MNGMTLKQALADGLVALALVVCMAQPLAQLADSWRSDWHLQSAALSMAVLFQAGRHAAMDGGLDADICWNGGAVPVPAGGWMLEPDTLALQLADDGAVLGRMILDRRLSLRSSLQTRPGDCWHYDTAGVLRQVGEGHAAGFVGQADDYAESADDADTPDDDEAHWRIALCRGYDSPAGGWQLTVPTDAPPSHRAARSAGDCNLEYTL